MEKKWQINKTVAGRRWDPVTRAPNPKKDKGHLAWLHELPCAVAAHPLPGATPCRGEITAHHPTGAGTALKAPDARAIPMCAQHHLEELHRFAGTFLGWPVERLHRWEAAMSDLYERLGALRLELIESTRRSR